MRTQAGAATAPTGHGSELPLRAARAPAAPARTPTFTPARAVTKPPSPASRPQPGPGTYARADLRPDRAATAQARRLTRDALSRWDMDALTEDAALIASELAANAICHATPPHGTLPAIIFAVHHAPGQIKIIVWDNGPGQPLPVQAGPDDETGRGLSIVNALTNGQWGWWPTPHSGGKVVWAALPAAGDEPGRPC